MGRLSTHGTDRSMKEERSTLHLGQKTVSLPSKMREGKGSITCLRAKGLGKEKRNGSKVKKARSLSASGRKESTKKNREEM